MTTTHDHNYMYSFYLPKVIRAKGVSTLDPYPKVLTANAWVKQGRNLGAYRAIVKQEEEAGCSSMAATGHKPSSPALLRRMPKKVTQL